MIKNNRKKIIMVDDNVVNLAIIPVSSHLFWIATGFRKR